MSSATRCRLCTREALTRVTYARMWLCQEHYREFIASKVERTIRRYELLRPGERLLVAVSGGKDSAALLHVMAGLRERLGVELVAFHIDLGIGDYSAKSKEAAERLAKGLGIELIVFDLRREIGLGVPELFRRLRRAPCSVCGLVKRYIMNAAAVEIGATLATAHNADDIATYIIKNFLIQEPLALHKMVPKLEGVKDLAAAKVRPLYEVYEREALLYSLSNSLPFVTEECPLAPSRGLDASIKRFLENLEEEHPGFTLSFLRRYVRTAGASASPGVKGGKVAPCRACGLISSEGLCSFCRVTERVLGAPGGSRVRDCIKAQLQRVTR